MTLVDVLFRYGLPPNERVMTAYGQLSDVYGIRRLQLNEAERTIRVEYDATRLTEAKVEGLLRAAGFDITDKPALV
jgi:copper chaperone CopZ